MATFARTSAFQAHKEEVLQLLIKVNSYSIIFSKLNMLLFVRKNKNNTCMLGLLCMMNKLAHRIKMWRQNVSFVGKPPKKNLPNEDIANQEF